MVFSVPVASPSREGSLINIGVSFAPTTQQNTNLIVMRNLLSLQEPNFVTLSWVFGSTKNKKILIAIFPA